MARILVSGRLSKLKLEEQLELICDYLIPAAYLRALKHGSKELKKIKFYRREATVAIINSELSKEEKFNLLEDLKSWFKFLTEDDQIGGYYLNNSNKKNDR